MVSLYGLEGLGFRVQGWGFRVWGFGFGIQGRVLGFGVWGPAGSVRFMSLLLANTSGLLLGSTGTSFGAQGLGFKWGLGLGAVLSGLLRRGFEKGWWAGVEEIIS